MPTVPNYNTSRVSESGLPGGGLNPNAPAEAFGGGRAVQSTFRSIEGLAETEVKRNLIRADATEQELKEQLQVAQDAHQLRMSQLDREIGEEWEKPAIFNEKTGALSRRGQSALGVGADLDKSFQKYVEEKRKGLATEAQRQDFEHLVEQRRQKIQEWARGHENRQITEFKVGEHSAGLENAKERAALWGDDKTAREELAKVRYHLGDLGVIEGWGPERTAQEIRKHESDLHTRIINRRLASRDVVGAKKYLAGVRDSIDPDLLAKIDGAMQETDALGEAQRAVDEVMNGEGPVLTAPMKPPAQTLPEALERIDSKAKDKDPMFREKARDLLKERWRDREVGEQLRQKAIYEKITKAHDANPAQDPRLIDPVGFRTLSTEYRDAIASRHKKVEVTDAARVLYLKVMSMTEEELGAMDAVDFDAKVFSKLPKQFHQDVQGRWTKAKDALREPSKRVEFKGLLSDEEMIFNAIKGTGLGGFKEADTFERFKEETKGKDLLQSEKLKVYMKFREDVNLALHYWSQANERLPNGKDKLDLIDKLLLPKVFVRGKKKPVLFLTAEDRKEARTPLANIQQVDRTAIENLIRSKKKSITDDKIERAYAAMVEMRDRYLAESIMEE